MFCRWMYVLHYVVNIIIRWMAVLPVPLVVCRKNVSSIHKSIQSSLRECPSHVCILFVWSLFSRVWLLLLLVHFSVPHLFLLFCLFFNVLGHGALWTTGFFSDDGLFVSCPACVKCQWSPFGQVSSQQSFPWLFSLQNWTERPFKCPSSIWS